MCPPCRLPKKPSFSGDKGNPPYPPLSGGQERANLLHPATGMKKRTPLDGRRASAFFTPLSRGGRGGWFSRREPAPPPGFEFWPSFRQSFPTKAGGNAESIFKQNDNTPAFHLPVIGANRSKKEEQRQNKWIPAQGRNDGNLTGITSISKRHGRTRGSAPTGINLRLLRLTLRSPPQPGQNAPSRPYTNPNPDTDKETP